MSPLPSAMTSADKLIQLLIQKACFPKKKGECSTNHNWFRRHSILSSQIYIATPNTLSHPSEARDFAIAYFAIEIVPHRTGGSLTLRGSAVP